MTQQLLLIIHTLLAFSIIGLVLIQHGKGAEAGAAFGSSAANSVFGSQGAGSFLTRTTTFLAIFFAATSIGLSILTNKGQQNNSISQKLKEAVTTNANIEDLTAATAEQQPISDSEVPNLEVPQN